MTSCSHFARYFLAAISALSLLCLSWRSSLHGKSISFAAFSRNAEHWAPYKPNRLLSNHRNCVRSLMLSLDITDVSKIARNSCKYSQLKVLTVCLWRSLWHPSPLSSAKSCIKIWKRRFQREGKALCTGAASPQCLPQRWTFLFKRSASLQSALLSL